MVGTVLSRVFVQARPVPNVSDTDVGGTGIAKGVRSVPKCCLKLAKNELAWVSRESTVREDPVLTNKVEQIIRTVAVTVGNSAILDVELVVATEAIQPVVAGEVGYIPGARTCTVKLTRDPGGDGASDLKLGWVFMLMSSIEPPFKRF